MNTQLELTDRERVDFLLRLDEAEFEVTEWEAAFLESFMARPDTLTARFSNLQRQAVDNMRKSYEHRLPPVKTEIPKAESRNFSLPPEAAGHCGYLVRGEDGRQRRCGVTAVTRNKHGLEFCADHEKQRAEAAARLREIKNLKLRS